MFPRKPSKPPVVKLKSGLVKKDIKFPATNICLWNPTDQGSIIPLHFAQYRNPQIQLTERAVLLANRHALQSKETVYRCFLVGHCLLNTDDEGITLIVDRFDPGSNTPGRTEYVPTTLLPGDFAVPLTISQGSADYFPTHSQQDITHSARLINHLVCSKESLAFGRLLPLRVHCTCYNHNDHVTIAIAISSVTVSNGYQLSPVVPVPILPTALARNLSGPLSLSEIQKTHKMGYMTMDQTRKLLLMIESDPKISTLPIVGLWLSGILSVYSPHAWAACLRFMHNSSIQERVLSETGCFLVVLYTLSSPQPVFYQCRPLEDEICFQLYECHENLHLMKNSKRSPVLLDLTPAKDGPQQATFLDAMQKFRPQRSSRNSSLSKSSKITPSTAGEIEEPNPQPSPKPLLHQNASLKPSVPELSVLFDSFDESIPKNAALQSGQSSCPGEQPKPNILPHPHPYMHQPIHQMTHNSLRHPPGHVITETRHPPYQSGRSYQHYVTAPVTGRGIPITDTPHHPVKEMKSKMMHGRGLPISSPVHQCHTAPVMHTGISTMESQTHGHLDANRPGRRRMSEQNYNNMPLREHRRMSAPSANGCACPHQGCLQSLPSPASCLESPSHERSCPNMPGSNAVDTKANVTADHQSNFVHNREPAGGHLQPTRHSTPATTGNRYHNHDESYKGVQNNAHLSEYQRGLHQHPKESMLSPVQQNDARDCSGSTSCQHHSSGSYGSHHPNQNHRANQDTSCLSNQTASRPGPDEHTLQQLKRQDELIKDLQAQVQRLLLAQVPQIPAPLTPPATPVHQLHNQPTQTAIKPDMLLSTEKKTVCNISVNTGASLYLANQDDVPSQHRALELPKQNQSKNEPESNKTLKATNQVVTKEGNSLPLEKINRRHQTSRSENCEIGHQILMSESQRNQDDLSARESSVTDLDDTLFDPQVQNDTRSLASSLTAVDLPNFNDEQVTTPQRHIENLNDSITSPLLGESASMLVRRPDAFIEGSIIRQADSLLYKDEAKFYDDLLGKVKQMLQGSKPTEMTTNQSKQGTELNAALVQVEQNNQPESEVEEEEDEDEEEEEEEDDLKYGDSMYLSMDAFPKINYHSMIDMSMDSNLSMEANAIAMKYLSDQQLTAMSESFKTTKDPSARTAILKKLSDKRGVDISTGGGVNMSMASMKYLEKHGLLDTSMNLNKRGRKDKGRKKVKQKPKENKMLKNKRKREESSSEDVDYSFMGQDSMVEPFIFTHGNDSQLEQTTHKPILVFDNRKRDFESAHAKNVSWNIGNASSPRTPLQTITNKAETETGRGVKVENGVKNILDVNRLKQLPKLL